jgi:hypothetical protein
MESKPQRPKRKIDSGRVHHARLYEDQWEALDAAYVRARERLRASGSGATLAGWRARLVRKAIDAYLRRMAVRDGSITDGIAP